jgi:glycosyltransferase involved in cell wall biosynthesis
VTAGAVFPRADMPPGPRHRTLVAIPAYNEAATIRNVVERVRANLPDCDVLVVNDGSQDATAAALAETGAIVVGHLCNLGYGRAIQTAVLYAQRAGYDRLVTLDADGQHDPAQVRALLDEFDRAQWDLLVGSRYVVSRRYAGVPFGRRVGMKLFSAMVGVMAGQRVYDTTSGLKVIGRQTFAPLTKWQFIDFHAEALVYLIRLGYRIGEYPITVVERRHGTTMYSTLSHIKYPLKTALMVVLGVVEASLARKRPS